MVNLIPKSNFVVPCVTLSWCWTVDVISTTELLCKPSLTYRIKEGLSYFIFNIWFYFSLFYLILFFFILFYFILFHYILFHFISFYFLISCWFFFNIYYYFYHYLFWLERLQLECTWPTWQILAQKVTS